MAAVSMLLSLKMPICELSNTNMFYNLGLVKIKLMVYEKCRFLCERLVMQPVLSCIQYVISRLNFALRDICTYTILHTTIMTQ